MKRYVMKQMNICEPIGNNCFCCKYALKCGDCSGCPVKWSNNSSDDRTCMNKDSSYFKARSAFLNYDYDIFRQLAKEVSELPEREDV